MTGCKAQRNRRSRGSDSSRCVTQSVQKRKAVPVLSGPCGAQKPTGVKIGLRFLCKNPDSVATTRCDTVGVLHGDRVFEVIVAEHIVALRAGIHPNEKARLEKRRAEVAKMFDK